MDQLTELDFTILRFIRENLSCGFLDFIMPIITLLGSGGILWIAIALAFLCFRKSRRSGIALSCGLIGSVLIGNLLIKNLVARARPCWIDDGAKMLIAVPTDYSFPSGHTSASFAAAVVIWHFNKKAGAAAFVIAALIGFSRMYLYVHFPTDVLVGGILGAAIGIAAFRLTDYFAERISAKRSGK